MRENKKLQLAEEPFAQFFSWHPSCNFNLKKLVNDVYLNYWVDSMLQKGKLNYSEAACQIKQYVKKHWDCKLKHRRQKLDELFNYRNTFFVFLFLFPIPGNFLIPGAESWDRVTKDSTSSLIFVIVTLSFKEKISKVIPVDWKSFLLLETGHNT